MKPSIALFATVAFIAPNPANASGVELANALMACTAKLSATKAYDSQIEDLPAIRVSAKEALEYLMGGERLSRDRRQAIADQTAAFEQTLLASPMNARNLVAALRDDCVDLIYDAEDARKQTVAEQEKTARLASEAEAKAKLEAERHDKIELEKLRLEASKDDNRTFLAATRIQSNTEVAIAEGEQNVEADKVAASVEIARIKGQTDRHQADRDAEVAIVRSGDDVEKSRIKADATVEVTKQLAHVEVIRSADDVEKTKLRADAAVTMTKEVAKVEVARIDAEVATTKLKAETTAEITAKMVDGAVKIETANRSSELTLDDADRTTGSLVIDGKPARILGVALGDGVEACTDKLRQIKLTKGSAGKNSPEAIVNVCQSGDQHDQRVLFFDAGRKFVVRVQRDVWLAASSDMTSTLRKAISTYGVPTKIADDGATLVYSSDVEVDGRRAPKGLKIRFLDCSANQCRAKGDHDRILSFNMIDVIGFAEAIKAGAAALNAERQETAEAIKF